MEKEKEKQKDNRYGKNKKSFLPKQKNRDEKKLKVIPLGGLNEIGKNITAFEYGNDIMLVDCGLKTI